MLAPGLYAWLLTVAGSRAQTGVPLVARAVRDRRGRCPSSAGVLPRERTAGHRARRSASTASSVARSLTWCLAGPAIAVGTVDPVALRARCARLGHLRVRLGSLARLTRPGRLPNVVAGAPLQPRSRLPRAAVLVAFRDRCRVARRLLAFRVDRSEPALFAHAAATACSLLLLGVGRPDCAGPRPAPRPAERLEPPEAAPVLGALIAVLLGLGLVWAAFAMTPRVPPSRVRADGGAPEPAFPAWQMS